MTRESRNILFILQRLWPILTSLRNHLPNALDIILACCILHNIRVKWGSFDPEEDKERDEDEDEQDENEEEMDDIDLIDDEINNVAIRARGAVLRDNMRNSMPPPTASEMRRIRLNR